MRPEPVAGIMPGALALVLAGCTGGTETGNPPFEAKLSYSAYSSMPDAVAVGNASGEIRVSAVWLDLGDVGFAMANACDGDPTLHAPGLGVGNHAGSKPASTSFTIEAGSYCAVDLPFVSETRGLPAEAPRELADHSIMLEGTFANGMRFSILSDTSMTVRLGPVGGDFTLQRAMPNSLIGFDVAKWIAGIDWSTGVVEGGTIAIDRDRNPALLGAFEARVAGGVSLFLDENGNGRVEAGAKAIAQGQ